MNCHKDRTDKVDITSGPGILLVPITGVLTTYGAVDNFEPVAVKGKN